MPKKPSPDPQTCTSCRFFLANTADEYGYCRRFPPVPSIQDGAHLILWPVTTASDWCGEFSRVTH